MLGIYRAAYLKNTVIVFTAGLDEGTILGDCRDEGVFQGLIDLSSKYATVVDAYMRNYNTSAYLRILSFHPTVLAYELAAVQDPRIVDKCCCKPECS
jgi:hypothetical protein